MTIPFQYAWRLTDTDSNEGVEYQAPQTVRRVLRKDLKSWVIAYFGVYEKQHGRTRYFDSAKSAMRAVERMEAS